MALRGRGIIQLGLLFFIATLVARVAFSIFGFAEERDRVYVVIAFNRALGFGLQPYRFHLVCIRKPKFRIKLARSLPCYIYRNAF